MYIKHLCAKSYNENIVYIYAIEKIAHVSYGTLNKNIESFRQTCTIFYFHKGYDDSQMLHSNYKKYLNNIQYSMLSQ